MIGTGWIIFFVVVGTYMAILRVAQMYSTELPVRRDYIVKELLDILEDMDKEGEEVRTDEEKEERAARRSLLKSDLDGFFGDDDDESITEKPRDQLERFHQQGFVPEHPLMDSIKQQFREEKEKSFWTDRDGTLMRKGNLLERYNMSIWGPFLMWRTSQGKKLIDRIAQKKDFWFAYGNLSLGIVTLIMIFMTLLLLWEAVIVVNIGSENAPSPELMIGIPGVNPIIPVWYGILALIVAMVVHEMAHGILTRASDLKVKALGILLCVIPMGAFVEPDEERLMQADRKTRDRIFAVGPATNLIAAVFFVLLFSWAFMDSIEPEENGIFVMRVAQDEPADLAGIEPGMVIMEIDGVPMDDYDAFKDSLKGKADQNVTMLIYDGEHIRNITVLLDNKVDHTEDEADNGTGYLGIFFPLTTEEHKELLSHPIRSGDTATEKIGNSFYFISLPFQKLSPFPEEFKQHYDVEGPLSVMPEGMFWVVANCLYWIFWLNLMVGLTNALPAVPLDGGYIFQDMIDKMVEKWKPDLTPEERAPMVDKVVLYFALSILALILWQLIGPYVGELL